MLEGISQQIIRDMLRRDPALPAIWRMASISSSCQMNQHAARPSTRHLQIAGSMTLPTTTPLSVPPCRRQGMVYPLKPIHPSHPRRLRRRPFRAQRLDGFHQIDPICDGIGTWWQGVLQAAFGNQNDRPFLPLIQQCHRFAPLINRASGPLHRNAPPKTPSPRTMRPSWRYSCRYRRAAVGGARR